MPVFEYKGKTLGGKQVQGELKAKNRAELERFLRGNRILVTNVSKKAQQIQIKFGSGIKKIDISRFTRQFATMISAGLPMVQCLEILATQMESAELRKVVMKVKESVQSGATLSEALGKHKKVYDDLYVNMVEAGEVGGALDTILIRLAQYREKADKLARKVKGALVYPIVVMIVAIGVTYAMLTFIVPVFAKMFSGLGAELPMPTQVVLGFSNFLKDNSMLMLLLLVLGVIGFKLYVRNPKGRLSWDTFKLRMPLLGTLIRKAAISRFTRTLATLLSSGVSILDALSITARTAGNMVLQNAINKSMLSIAEGETITQPLKESGVFPPMVTQMISVGEKTGGMDDMLAKIADFYDDEVDAAVAALTSIIDMYLPMFDIIGKIS
jgi:type IV pilus assembly protein PilC